MTAADAGEMDGANHMGLRMKGWQIFRHSVRQVFGNLGAALKVSGVLYLVQLGVTLGLGVDFSQMDQATIQARVADGSLSLVPLISIFAVSLVVGLWITVAWHRYVLRSEWPKGVVPAFHGDRMAAYFGQSLLIGAVMLPVALIWAFAIGLLFFDPQAPEAVLTPVQRILSMLVLEVPLLVFAFRFSAGLPGVALGDGGGIGLAWRKTAGHTGDLILVAVLASVLFWGIEQPAALFAGSAPLVSRAWLIATGWVQMMVGISILTTLYGHYIEGRTLV